MWAIASKDTEVLTNSKFGDGFGFSDEFQDYLVSVGYWNEHSYITTNERTNPILIEHVRAFGLDRVSSEEADIVIDTIPAFHVGRIIGQDDGVETLEVSFPWEAFAMALYLHIKNEPVVGEYKLVLDAIENGTLKIPHQ